jgi:2-C-methyl-D-erythritol 4-phosphate cytidylyltransferase
MFSAQTPQCFKHSIISKAHEDSRSGAPSATDDVSLVLAAGFSVKMILGDYSNFKITTDFDYQAACRVAESMTDSDRRS